MKILTLTFVMIFTFVLIASPAMAETEEEKEKSLARSQTILGAVIIGIIVLVIINSTKRSAAEFIDNFSFLPGKDNKSHAAQYSIKF